MVVDIARRLKHALHKEVHVNEVVQQVLCGSFEDDQTRLIDPVALKSRTRSDSGGGDSTGRRGNPACMAVRRIMPYHESPDFEATRAFYTRVLGLDEGNFGGGYIGFGSGQAQVVFAPPGVEPALPDMGVDVGSRGAVDAAHAEAVQAGHEVIYGPVDEPWGVRRFFVRDPHGVVISVLAHE
jgi:predicted enzyme related to lactoylglutathione lyase